MEHLGLGNPNAKPQGVSVETFVMTHSELFLQLMEQTTRLVTHDLDGSSTLPNTTSSARSS